MNNFHRVIITIDTDDSERLKSIIPFVLGLQGMLPADTQLDYAVERSAYLDEQEDRREQEHDDLPF